MAAKPDAGLMLDSVILIDHLNGIAAAREYLRGMADRCHVSAITRAEVLAGTEPAVESEVRALLDAFPLLVIDRDTADLAAALRRTYRWRLPDALQAACARRYGMTLVTRDTRDFPAGRFDWVVVPYAIG